MLLSKPSILRHPALSLALAATILVLASGCAVVVAGAAGAGTVAYIRGELDATLNERYDRVISASNDAVEKLELARISEAKDVFSAVIIARTAEDKKVRIKLTKEGEKMTKVQIRIGIFGDEEKSRAILDRINAGL
jgi:hypothetical protein